MPIAVGVPLSTPAGLKLRPIGKGPELDASDQIYGVIPPLAASVCVYATPNFAPGKLAVVMTSGAAMRKVRVRGADCAGDPESVACTVKVEPRMFTVVGVPLITPAVESVSPGGKAPETTAQETFPVPPEAVSICRYGEPVIPSGRVSVPTESGVATCSDSTMLAVWLGNAESST